MNLKHFISNLWHKHSTGNREVHIMKMLAVIGLSGIYAHIFAVGLTIISILCDARLVLVTRLVHIKQSWDGSFKGYWANFCGFCPETMSVGLSLWTSPKSPKISCPDWGRSHLNRKQECSTKLLSGQQLYKPNSLGSWHHGGCCPIMVEEILHCVKDNYLLPFICFCCIELQNNYFLNYFTSIHPLPIPIYSFQGHGGHMYPYSAVPMWGVG